MGVTESSLAFLAFGGVCTAPAVPLALDLVIVDFRRARGAPEEPEEVDEADMDGGAGGFDGPERLRESVSWRVVVSGCSVNSYAMSKYACQLGV